MTAFTESRLGSVDMKNSGLVSRVHVLGGFPLVGGVEDMADVENVGCWVVGCVPEYMRLSFKKWMISWVDLVV